MTIPQPNFQDQETVTTYTWPAEPRVVVASKYEPGNFRLTYAVVTESHDEEGDRLDVRIHGKPQTAAGKDHATRSTTVVWNDEVEQAVLDALHAETARREDGLS